MDTQELLARAKQRLKEGDKDIARQILDKLLMEDPRNEQAWMLLADAVLFDNERLDCLAQVLAINPNNQAARDRYNWLKPKPSVIPH